MSLHWLLTHVRSDFKLLTHRTALQNTPRPAGPISLHQIVHLLQPTVRIQAPGGSRVQKKSADLRPAGSNDAFKFKLKTHFSDLTFN